MYIFLRNCYVRNLRSNELLRSCHYHHRIRNSLFQEKHYLHQHVKSSTRYSLSPIICSHFLSTCNPLLCSNDNKLSQSNSLIIVRRIGLSAYKFEKVPLKPSSKVEVTVQALKDEQKQKEAVATVQKKEQKKSLPQRIKDELMHYYHGFRLLFTDVKVSLGLVKRMMSGKTLTRREHNLLVRTTGDLFRLLPFSVFIIVPFMELALPLYIKFFPGMLPNTFQTAKDREDKLKNHLKVKLEVAKFFQKTLDEMAVQHKERDSNKAKEFAEWFQKVRTSGQASNEDIMRFSKLFQDEITLDSLTRGQLVALCRVLEVHTLGTNNLLRFQLRMKLRSLAADDKLIQKEGVDSLTITELQNACKARGMRAYGLTEEMLRKQLSNWLDLSLNQQVPPILLLLSQALMLPEAIPTTDKLKATISALPDSIVAHTTVAIGEQEGKIDNKMKLELLKQEVKKITEERQEELKEKELLVDKAPIIDAARTPAVGVKTIEDMKKVQISSKDLEALGDALNTVAKNKLIVEKETIEDLKEEMADYQEDVKELKEVTDNVKESSAAKRLFNRVNKMIQKMDSAVAQLEAKEKKMKAEYAGGESKVTKEDIIRIDELLDAIKRMQKVPNADVLNQIETMLSKMDDDRDGSIKVDDVLKVITLVGKENVQLNQKQVEDIIDLIGKEETLEVEDKIEKALQKDVSKPKPKIVSNEQKEKEDVSVTSTEMKTEDTTKDNTPKAEAQHPTTTILPPPISSITSPKKDGDSKTI